MELAAAELPRLEAHLDSLVAEIVAVLAPHDPLEVLRMAYGYFALAVLGTRSESEVDADKGAYSLSVEYIQSVIAGTPPSVGQLTPIEEGAFKTLHSKIDELYSTCAVDLMIARTAAQLVATPQRSPDPGEELRAEAQMWWIKVRKIRYDAHECPYLSRFLTPHSQILTELYGVSASQLVEEVSRVHYALTRGLGQAVEAFAAARERFFGVLDQGKVSTEDELEEVLAALREEPQMVDAKERFFGDANFDIQYNATLPVALLDVLSWEPGEERQAFREGDGRGWPLRILPWRLRPFLKIGGRYYCHNPSALFDRLYRQIERAVCDARPEYREQWKELQSSTLERFALELLTQLLPGATVLGPVWYQWPSTTSRKRNWVECDGLVLFDDHMIIVEARSGSFTYTAPTDDFDAHTESLLTLLQKPWDQTQRFVEYLESAESVPLYRRTETGNHEEVVRVSRRDYRVVTRCGVTLDNFGHLAARAEKLQPVGVAGAGGPVWSIAIDDLMVCADVLDSGVTFCHYLEQRRAASENPDFVLRDEIDHLGMYFQRNMYSSLTDGAPAPSTMQWVGFGAVIDGYFADLMSDPATAKKPRQELPQVLAEVIAALDRSTEANRCRAASVILNLGGEGRKRMAEQLSRLIATVCEEGRLLTMSLPGESALTFLVSTPRHHWDTGRAREQVTLAMLAVEQHERVGLELVVGADGALGEARPFLVRRDDIAPSDLVRLESDAKQLVAKRIEKEIDSRARPRIGRNEKCPCGSDKKYKKCHGKP